jgi:hypothetical protein
MGRRLKRRGPHKSAGVDKRPKRIVFYMPREGEAVSRGSHVLASSSLGPAPELLNVFINRDSIFLQAIILLGSRS